MLWLFGNPYRWIVIYGDPETFFNRFLVSDISKQFGMGNPRYIAGMSGIELAEMVIEETGGEPLYAEYKTSGRSESYWAGWALAYLQWFTGYSFEKISEWGVSIISLLSLYPTHHEADITKLIETAVRKMDDPSIMNAFSIPQNGEFTLRKFGDSKLLITEASSL